MQVISKKTVEFKRYDYPKVKQGEEIKAVLKETVRVVRSDKPQIVPDWVKDDQLYRLMLKDKDIMQVVFEVVDDNPDGDKDKKPEDVKPTDLPANGLATTNVAGGWNKK